MATPRGLRNNNPLNIEKTKGGNPWQGEIVPSKDSRFAQFTSMAYGYRAAFKLLNNYQRNYGLDTIRKMISRWAPSNENHTEAYVKAGCKRTDWQDMTCEQDVGMAAGVDFALFFPSPLASAGLKAMADGAEDGSMAVLIGIHENNDMKLLWRECRRSVKNVVLFDLYYCGLVCFDRKRYKQEYVINF